MQEKSKILILSSAYLPLIGGSELAIKNITDRLPDFEFDLITGRFSKQDSETERVGNIMVYRVGNSLSLSKFLLPKSLLPLSIFFKARSLLKKNDYKLIHAYQASGAAGAGWLLKMFNCPVPLMITLQEGKNLESQGLLINFFRNLIIKKADYATAISCYLKNYISGINGNLRIEMIPNGVDIDKFSKDFSYGEMTAIDNKLGLQPDDKVVISSSRLVPKNGMDLLIRAMAIIGKNSKDKYKLVLIGDGIEKNKLVDLARELGAEDKVIFAGSVNNEELPIYLKIADVFVRPSRSEGLGISFLEAMAAGIPIIGTKVGGIPDFLEDRKTGIFCSLEPEDIAFKIQIVVENSQLRQDLTSRAFELVKDKYDWDIVADKFRGLYSRF